MTAANQESFGSNEACSEGLAFIRLSSVAVEDPWVVVLVILISEPKKTSQS
jgi:hypothetical protein